LFEIFKIVVVGKKKKTKLSKASANAVAASNATIVASLGSTRIVLSLKKTVRLPVVNNCDSSSANPGWQIKTLIRLERRRISCFCIIGRQRLNYVWSLPESQGNGTSVKEPLLEWRGHTRSVYAVFYEPCNDSLVSTGDD